MDFHENDSVPTLRLSHSWHINHWFAVHSELACKLDTSIRMCKRLQVQIYFRGRAHQFWGLDASVENQDFRSKDDYTLSEWKLESWSACMSSYLPVYLRFQLSVFIGNSYYRGVTLRIIFWIPPSHMHTNLRFASAVRGPGPWAQTLGQAEVWPMAPRAYCVELGILVAHTTEQVKAALGCVRCLKAYCLTTFS